jgi:S-adenosylmethionine:tRNA ribosyltransferase-isomerase
VTLHVGAGTFKPVKSENIADHPMHSESFYIELELIESILEAIGKNRIIAVGTTSMRTVESVYWFGVQLIQSRFNGSESKHFSVGAIRKCRLKDSKKALKAVIDHMKQSKLTFLNGKTNIIIVPGYDFKIFSGLVTNFHQPSSTLLMLIAAFIGSDWKMLYEYALKNDFRFLSYGDSSILLK